MNIMKVLNVDVGDVENKKVKQVLKNAVPSNLVLFK
jgi:hypothetical protein